MTLTRRAFAAITLTTSLVAFGSSIAGASSSGSELTDKQILKIALEQARAAQDPKPTRIEVASGPARKAVDVMGQPGMSPGVDPTEKVDLVVMHGHFHINAPHPRNKSIAPGKVLELLIDGHSGFVLSRFQGNRVPVALSKLGHVTRLR